MIPMFFPSHMSLSLLPSAASSGLGQRQDRQGWGRLLWHRDRGPGFGDEAPQRPRGVVEQRHQDQVPAPAKDTDQPQAGGPPRPAGGSASTSAVTSGTRAGLESSPHRPRRRPSAATRSPPATARHRRAARAGGVMWVRCHCPPARLVILQPGSIQARNPYQQAVLASGGRSVRINQGSVYPPLPARQQRAVELAVCGL